MSDNAQLINDLRHLVRSDTFRTSAGCDFADRAAALADDLEAGSVILVRPDSEAEDGLPGEWYQSELRACRQRITELEQQLDAAQLSSIEARNPGIDLDEVRRIRGR